MNEKSQVMRERLCSEERKSIGNYEKVVGQQKIMEK
jgi:hypothetical protein